VNVIYKVYTSETFSKMDMFHRTQWTSGPRAPCRAGTFGSVERRTLGGFVDSNTHLEYD